MATFDMDFVHSYPGKDEGEILENFARKDGSLRIYKVSMSANSPHTHYVSIRKPLDEAAMRSSSSVHNPVLVWPLNERRIPLLKDFTTIEVEADSLEEAREKMRSQMPEGFELFSQKIIANGNPIKKVIDEIEVEAPSIDQAREMIKSRIRAGLELLYERVVSDGSPQTIKAERYSIEEAFTQAQSKLPPQAEILEKKEIRAYERKTIIVKEFDEKTAYANAKQEAEKQGVLLKNMKLVTPGRKGLFGIGAVPSQYEAELIQSALVEVVYKVTPKISAQIGAIQKTKAKISVTIGRKPGSAKGVVQEVGILFDIDELGGGLYRWEAFKIIFKNLDPKRLSACTFFDGDTRETLSGKAQQFCIAVQALDGSKIDYIKETMSKCEDKGLLPLTKRFLDGNVTSQHPLVVAGEVDSNGSLRVKEGSGIGDGWVKETMWTVTKI